MPHVFDELARLVGRVEPDGSVYTAQGQLVGGVGPDGKVYEVNGQVLGWVDQAGLIYDSQGIQRGEVWSDGGIYAWPRSYAGYVAAGLPRLAMGGAALLLLVRSQP